VTDDVGLGTVNHGWTPDWGVGGSAKATPAPIPLTSSTPTTTHKTVRLPTTISNRHTGLFLRPLTGSTNVFALDHAPEDFGHYFIMGWHQMP
jgi:hypothetical protein